MKHRIPPRTGLAVALLAAACSNAPVRAQDAKALRNASLAASCAQCHGTFGRMVEGSMVPGLAGQSADTLARQMKAFKTGTRPGTVMPQLAKGYSDAQIAQLAAYFAAQARTVGSKP